MTRVITVLNAQQGGGKTITVLNLAAALQQQGLAALAVDLDAQGALAQRVRLADSARAGTAPRTGIVATAEGWHLMPSAMSIALAHSRALYRVVRRTAFYDELRALFDAYDYVLLDASTREEMLLGEALALAQEVIVPLDSESLQFYDAVERLRQLLRARSALNPPLRFGGVFLARYAPRFRRAREMLTALFDALGPVYCFSAYLKEADAVRQAEKRRMSVLADAPRSAAAQVFARLATQIRDATPAPLLAAARAVAEAQPANLPTAAAPGDAGAWDGNVAPNALEPNARSWLERARAARSPDQAVRYAVLALDREPGSAEAVRVFESLLLERLETAQWADAERLLELGRFLTEHRFDHYAWQLFRRATELNPTFTSGWAALVQQQPTLAMTTHADAEHARALDVCLSLDQGLTAA